VTCPYSPSSFRKSELTEHQKSPLLCCGFPHSKRKLPTFSLSLPFFLFSFLYEPHQICFFPLTLSSWTHSLHSEEASVIYLFPPSIFLPFQMNGSSFSFPVFFFSQPSTCLLQKVWPRRLFFPRFRQYTLSIFPLAFRFFNVPCPFSHPVLSPFASLLFSPIWELLTPHVCCPVHYNVSFCSCLLNLSLHWSFPFHSSCPCDGHIPFSLLGFLIKRQIPPSWTHQHSVTVDA